MLPLNVHVPDANYHQNLISCQVACPVHTDARGYVRAIADGRFEEAYLIARGPNPFASIVLTTFFLKFRPKSHCQSSAEIN
jgi:NADPH-dependent glutamate synthase beta subunit-like oxidoreductase